MERIYFDNNATTRIDPEVLEKMLPYFGDRYGNPSSVHWFGQEAHRAMDLARRQVADLIGALPEEIVFTSGGTEADNQALIGIAGTLGEPGSRIITTSIEHQAVLNTCRYLEKKGFKVTYLPVGPEGRIDSAFLADAIDDDVILVSIMFGNNETGALQPVQEAAAVAGSRGILFHSDAVQAVGRVPIDVNVMGIDLLSLSGHKLHGPKGSGALFVRRGIPEPVLIHGGHHERHRRAGTENVAAIVGLGYACRLAKQRIAEANRTLTALRDRLERSITARVAGATVNGSLEHRLPNTSNLSFEGVDGQMLAINLDLMGIAVSTGSACQAESREPSYVLTAMGVDEDRASSCIRFSLSLTNTADEVDRVVEAVSELAEGLRAQ